jgi:hypothetical protein
MNLSRGEVPKNTFFINYLMNKGVLMQINCIMSLEALQNYRIRQSMLILKAIRVVAEVLNPKNIKIAQREALMWGPINRSIEYGNVVHEILSFVKQKKH